MGRKSLSSKTQSNQNRGREGILNQSLNREGIQRGKKPQTSPHSSTTVIMHVISRGFESNLALKAREPHADFHQFQVSGHNLCRHRLSLLALDCPGGCDLLDGHYCQLPWLTQNSGCVFPVCCISTLHIWPRQVRTGQ